MSLQNRLREALGRAPTGTALAGDIVPGPNSAARAAAVLIAITDRPQPGVILTVRHEALRTHAGQIAFPGGRIDPGEDAAQAALREAWEELALDPAQVSVVGRLESYRTVTGFAVTPMLAVIPPDLPLTPHDVEVADWFEAPLGFLIDPANRLRKRVVFEQQERHYYEIVWNERRIWGATAAMLVNLSRRLQW